EVATGMSHGRAVSVGMACEAEIAVRMGLCHKGLKERQDGLLRLFGLPTEPPKVDLGKFSFALSRDKKARKGRVRFVLPRALGWVEVREDVPLDLVLEVVGLR
ncbi:MAG TPA: 3-dehydroquinate synthase, partial [Armatimonadetes bacterium]|nr:3-dehydroquinate synthase [Armatimonadota bacterium]